MIREISIVYDDSHFGSLFSLAHTIQKQWPVLRVENVLTPNGDERDYVADHPIQCTTCRKASRQPELANYFGRHRAS